MQEERKLHQPFELPDFKQYTPKPHPVTYNLRLGEKLAEDLAFKRHAKDRRTKASELAQAFAAEVRGLHPTATEVTASLHSSTANPNNSFSILETNAGGKTRVAIVSHHAEADAAVRELSKAYQATEGIGVVKTVYKLGFGKKQTTVVK